MTQANQSDQPQPHSSPSLLIGALLGFVLAIYLSQKNPQTFKNIQKFIADLIKGIHQKPIAAPKPKPRPRPRTFRRSQK